MVLRMWRNPYALEPPLGAPKKAPGDDREPPPHDLLRWFRRRRPREQQRRHPA